MGVTNLAPLKGSRPEIQEYFISGLIDCLIETLGTRVIVFACLVTCTGDGVDLMVNGEDREQVWDLVAGRSGGRVWSRAIHADTWRRRAIRRFPTVWP